jgi:trigger factor
MDKEHIVTETREAGLFERILTVTIAGDALVKAENKAARKLSQEVKIKGFRPGKAPRSLVEKVVGAETLRREAVDEALPEAVAGAIRESDLKPVVAPRVEDIREIEEGVEVDVLVTLWPEIDILPDYRGREIEIERPDISDEDLEKQIERIKQIERMRDQFAELEDVDREAFDGDYVLIDISRVDGDDIAKDMMYEVGSGTFIDGLDIPLRGSRAGSIEEFDTTLPQIPRRQWPRCWSSR